MVERGNIYREDVADKVQEGIYQAAEDNHHHVMTTPQTMVGVDIDDLANLQMAVDQVDVVANLLIDHHWAYH
jgi:hypothetical protein